VTDGFANPVCALCI